MVCLEVPVNGIIINADCGVAPSQSGCMNMSSVSLTDVLNMFTKDHNLGSHALYVVKDRRAEHFPVPAHLLSGTETALVSLLERTHRDLCQTVSCGRTDLVSLTPQGFVCTPLIVLHSRLFNRATYNRMLICVCIS